ncbi:hypothetical protein BC628DRAFT_291931 [Trametes gibbosa]|nr:hypothetical protein BC628DRAFT_291931 [Trametes gibbosa]
MARTCGERDGKCGQQRPCSSQRPRLGGSVASSSPRTRAFPLRLVASSAWPSPPSPLSPPRQAVRILAATTLPSQPNPANKLRAETSRYHISGASSSGSGFPCMHAQLTPPFNVHLPHSGQIRSRTSRQRTAFNPASATWTRLHRFSACFVIALHAPQGHPNLQLNVIYRKMCSKKDEKHASPKQVHQRDGFRVSTGPATPVRRGGG